MIARKKKDHVHITMVAALKPMPMRVRTAGIRGGTSSGWEGDVEVGRRGRLALLSEERRSDEEEGRIVTRLVGIRVKEVGEGGGGAGEGICWLCLRWGRVCWLAAGGGWGKESVCARKRISLLSPFAPHASRSSRR